MDNCCLKHLVSFKTLTKTVSPYFHSSPFCLWHRIQILEDVALEQDYACTEVKIALDRDDNTKLKVRHSYLGKLIYCYLAVVLDVGLTQDTFMKMRT